ncbi:MAG: hypothetical protein JW712_04560 [Dehalococcoidales bacterium]|nr:hypothetical protein [Dehalococcoidales bacterium]
MLDWLTEPSTADKVANCGKLTQITIYSNGTVMVRAFYCHRYDCPQCFAKRKVEIKSKIMKVSKFWFMTLTDEDHFSAVKKRITRTGEKYCAVGRGDNILVLTLHKVLENTRVVGMEHLENLIDKHLDCEYNYRKRRLRHSRGLFPSEKKSLNTIHIKRRYATIEPLLAVVERFTNDGYNQQTASGEYYLRPFLSKHAAEEVLNVCAANLVWSE